MKLWAADGKHLRDFPPLGDWAYAASFAARDSRVVAGSWLGEVKVWETGEGKEVGMLRLTPEPIAEAVVAQAP